MKSNAPYLMLVSKKTESIGLSDNRIILDKPIVSIGRKSNNDIVVKSQTLSGHHADIVVTEKGNKTIFVLKDNQSTNKTFVNDIPIKEYVLHNNDLIRFGDVEFIFNNIDDEEGLSLTTVMLDLESKADVDMEKTKNLDPFFEARKQKAEKLRYIFLSLLIFLGLSILIIVIFFFSILTSVSII